MSVHNSSADVVPFINSESAELPRPSEWLIATSRLLRPEFCRSTRIVNIALTVLNTLFQVATSDAANARLLLALSGNQLLSRSASHIDNAASWIPLLFVTMVATGQIDSREGLYNRW